MNYDDVVLGLHSFDLSIKKGHIVDYRAGSLISCKKDNDELSFYIKSGELVLLTGANGSGKTSLIEEIINIKSAQSRREFKYDFLIFNGAKYKNINSINILGHIGFSPNELEFSANWFSLKSLVNEMTRDYLDMDNQYYKFDHDRLEYLFKRFYSDSKYDNDYYKVMLRKRFSKCSSGQKKKFSIIKALIRKGAPLYIFDEPLNCLDTRTIISFLDEINKLRNEQPKSAILVITHCLLFDKPNRVYKIYNKSIIDDTKNYRKANCLSFLK